MPDTSPSQKPLVIVYKESMAQSIISDVVTMGLLLVCIFASRHSVLWSALTAALFLFVALDGASRTRRSKRVMRFYSLEQLQQWLDGQTRNTPPPSHH